MSIATLLQIQLERIYPSSALTSTLGTFDFRVGNNQDLLIVLLEKAQNKKDNYVSYKAFQNFFNSALHGSQPIKPKQDNPDYNDPTRKAIYSAKKYRVYKLWRYHKDLKKYHGDLQKHQTQQAHLRSILQTYRNNHRGYIKFIRATLSATSQESETSFFLRPHVFKINEKARQRHSYITGQSGSGKTELLKIMIHHYLTVDTKKSVILLDPHGDIAEQVAQFKECVDNDRLVYIDPSLSLDHTPVINPFTLPSKKTPIQEIDTIAEELYGVFKDILKSSFTPQMETLLRPCITTLLLMGNKDLNDLQRFMDDDRNHHYLNFALKNLYNPAQVDFLKYDFHKDTYNPTKQAIKTKIQSLLNSNTFRNLLTGKPTFNLDQLTQQNKIVIFNLSVGKMGNDSSDVIGRFLLSQIKTIAYRREKIPEPARPHVHVFIDECQRYISPTIKTILAEARKYHFYLTLANQYYGQEMGTDIRNAITSNTVVKIAGANNDKNATTHHKETSADVSELKTLGVGEFHVKEGNKPSIKIKTPTTLLGNKNAMTNKQWEHTKTRMIAQYYSLLAPVNLEESQPTITTREQQIELIHAPEKPHKMTADTDNIKPKFDLDL